MARVRRPPRRDDPRAAGAPAQAGPIGKTPAVSGGPEERLATWGPPLLVALLTVLVFLPALGNGFVSLDDDKNFLNNPEYRGLGWSQLQWMFSTTLMGHYIPVTWLTLGLDYLVWGMNPFGYHLTNVALHAANAAVFYMVVRRLLGGGVVGPAAAALLFALHPLRVESVAWVTERRDVLSGLAYLLTVLAYLRSCSAAGPRERRRWYWIAVAVFGVGLLAKSMLVTLPAVLLILDVYPLRRLPGRRGWLGPDVLAVWLEKVPFAAMAVLDAGITIRATTGVEEFHGLSDVGLLDRVAIALYGTAFYLWKSLVPLGLSPMYALPRPVTRLGVGIVAGAVVLAGVSALAIAVRRRWPGVLAAWVAYLVVLVPVGGLFHNGPQVAADRYTYLPMLGWAVLAGVAVEWGWRRARRDGEGPGRVVAMAGLALTVAVIAVLAGLTWRQTGVWRDSETLWAHTAAVSPSAMAYNDFGALLGRQGRLDEATQMYRRALAMDPDLASAHHNLGVAFIRQQRWEEAKQEFGTALRLDPSLARSHVNLGAILVQEGRFSEALPHLREAVRLAPDLVEAHYNLGRALDGVGRLDEAIVSFEWALRMRPDHEPSRQALLQARARAGRPALR